MDTFFPKKTEGKTSWGNTFCQLFVIYKRFVVAPMKSKSKVIQQLKQFSKEIGPPDIIISDTGGEQTYKAMMT